MPMTNKTFIHHYKALIPFLLLWFLSLYFFQFVKGDVVLMLNKIHSSFWNIVFTKFSSIGNALSIFFFLFIVLWRFELKYLYFFVLAFFLESLIVVVCKNLIFNDLSRPYLFFKAQGVLEQINFVEGVKVSKRRSFPSGHTAYSFCMALFFALKFNQKYVSIILAICAAFVAAARMYLVQHFFIDVFAGAFVGISMTSLAYYIVFRAEKKWYNNRIVQRVKIK